MAMRTKTWWILFVSTSATLACAGASLAGCGDDVAEDGGAGDGGTDATTDSKVNPVDGGRDTSVPDADASNDAGSDATDASSDATDAACGDAQTTCSGACVDIATNAANCGACGHACGGTLTCANGHCSNELSSVSAGDSFSCVLKADGSVWCWGSNQMGELGTAPSASDLSCGTVHCNQVPQKVPGIADARAIAAGREFACVIRDDRSVWCWGKNDLAQLGHAPATGGDGQCDDLSVLPLADGGVAPAACNPTPQQITFPAGVKIAQISAGPSLVCARTEAADGGTSMGDVYCWGNNGHDTIGLSATSGGAISTPNKISVFTSDVIDVRVGGDTRFACAVRQDGTVWCWGDAFQGRIGIPEGTAPECGGNECTPTPSEVRVQAAAGADAGDADIGLGAPLTGVKSVALGDGSACALKNDGTVWCWGNDSLAALADNGPYNADQHPGARLAPGLPASIAKLLRTTRSALAIDATGAAWAWGDNTFGAIGNGTTAGVTCATGGDGGACIAPPAKVVGLAGGLEIATGFGTGVLLKPDLTVWTWGRNGHAELGHLPSTAGDVICSSGASGIGETVPCNPTPSQVTIP